MAKRPPITETVLQILREAPEPLALDAVAAQLEARLPGASKNYKGSVRNTLANNRNGAIIRLPDGRLGLKARLINGSSLRQILYDEDLAERALVIGVALADLLDPSGSLSRTGAALRLELADGPQILARIDAELGEHYLDARGAAPGDSLIVTAIDADARRYALRHEPAAERDEATIAARNEEVLAAAVAILRRARGRAPLWEIVSNLNASGVLRHPTPPDPLEEIWTEDVYGPVQEHYGVDFPLTGGRAFDDLEAILGMTHLRQPAQPEPGATQVEIGPEDLPPGVSFDELSAKIRAIYTPEGLRPIPADDPMLPAVARVAARSGLPSPTGAPYRASDLLSLFGSDDDVLDWIDEGIALGMVQADDAYAPFEDEAPPPDLPAAYVPTGARRKPQPSPQGRKGPVKTFLLRLTYADRQGFSRDIEIAEDQNLEDLHLCIQQAIGWDDDYLYSFFMGRKPFTRAGEIGSPWSDCERHTHRVTLGSLDLKPKQKFFYLFDYGDEHLFTLEVLKVNPQAPKGSYPKVVAREGRAPRQY